MSSFVVRTRQVRPGTRIKDNPPTHPPMHPEAGADQDRSLRREELRMDWQRCCRIRLPTGRFPEKSPSNRNCNDARRANCRIPNPESASQPWQIPCCHRYRFLPQPGLCPVELPSPIWRSAPVVRSLNRSESVGSKPMACRNVSDGAARGEREASRLPPIDPRKTLLPREKRATHRGSRLVPSEPPASAIF